MNFNEKEIPFKDVREIIYKLKELGYNIAKVTYDGWNSIESRQILQEQGFNVGLQSVDRTSEPYETMRELLIDNRLNYYYYKPFIEECRNLEFLKGRKVDHSPTGSKDVADGVAGSVFTCIKEGVLEDAGNTFFTM